MSLQGPPPVVEGEHDGTVIFREFCPCRRRWAQHWVKRVGEGEEQTWVITVQGSCRNRCLDYELTTTRPTRVVDTAWRRIPRKRS